MTQGFIAAEPSSMDVARLSSYRPVVLNRASHPISVIKLSQAGFRYAGEGSLITCDVCQKVWEMDAFIGNGFQMLEPSQSCFHAEGCQFINVVFSDKRNNGHSITAGLPENSSANNVGHGNETRHFNNDLRSLPVGRHERQETIECQTSSVRPAIRHDTTVNNTNSLNGIVNGSHNFRQEIFSQASSHSNGSRIAGPPTDTNQHLPPSTDRCASHSVTSPVYKVLTSPSYPVFISYKKRLESFTNWQHHHIHRPDFLAERGFFYAGYADCVRCFQCGLGLRSWKPGDDVYVQHQKHRPNCPYLIAHGVTGNDDNTRKDQNSTKRGDINIKSGIKKQKTGDMLAVTLLEIENSKLQEQLTCKVCHKEPIKDLFLPCGELYACTECSKLLTHCPSCNRQILATVTTFLC